MRRHLIRAAVRAITLAGLAAALALSTALAAELPAGTPRSCREMAEAWSGDAAGLLAFNREAETTGETSGAAANILSAYFAAREADVRGEASLFAAEEPRDAGEDFPVSDTVRAENLLRGERLSAMAETLNIAITDAAVRVRMAEEAELLAAEGESDGSRTPAVGVRLPSVDAAENGPLVLYLSEWTFFDYDDLSDGPGGTDVSAFETVHKLTLSETDGGYRIVSDEYDESDLTGFAVMSDETRAEFVALGYLPAPEEEAPVYEENPPVYEEDGAPGDFAGAFPDSGTAFAGEDEAPAFLLGVEYCLTYDVAAAVAYSERWWDGFNPEYANYNSVGGDCANFTSQSINAGHMPQVPCAAYGTSGWYYTSENNRSATWTGSTYHRRWFGQNRGYLTTASRSTVYTGSPVYYSTKGDNTFQHTVICAGKNSAGTPIINSHNRARYHVLWNYYTGSVVIDTVQLTSERFGDFDSYVNLGEDFYARVHNPELDRYVTNDGGGVLTSRADSGRNDQIWRFTRQEDGSYRILSALDEGGLAVDVLWL